MGMVRKNSVVCTLQKCYDDIVEDRNFAGMQGL